MLGLSLACAVPQLLAKKKEKLIGLPSANEQKRAVHALNRLAFGPRPGDIQQVMAMGVDNWIDLQLHPEKIPDTAAESRLAGFRTLRMSSREIAEEFPDNQMVKQVMDGKKSMPTDAAKRAVYSRADRAAGRKEGTEEKKAAAVGSSLHLLSRSSGHASDSAKTAEELAAAAAASGDATGNAPNNLADANAMNATSQANGAVDARSRCLQT